MHRILPPVEITDLLWQPDPATGARRPARRDDALARLAASEQSRAARIVAQLPTDGADFDGWVCALRDEQPELPVRIVDVGCGIGYVIGWLAAHQPPGPGVELYGVDFDETLIRHATRLADAEGLSCQFVAGDALRPGTAVQDGARTIVISSGLLHHLTPAELPDFFAAQQRVGVAAFAHWDPDPSRLATFGAWIFHRARMREVVSRYDGVLSARRAHPAGTLLDAARGGAPDYRATCADASGWRPNVIDIQRPITGTARLP